MNASEPAQDDRLTALFSFSPTVYSMLGGLFISISVNMFTAVFMVDVLPKCSALLLSASALTAFSAVAWLLLSLWLDAAHAAASRNAPPGADVKAALAVLLMRKWAMLRLALYVGCVSASVGLLLLPYRMFLITNGR